MRKSILTVPNPVLRTKSVALAQTTKGLEAHLQNLGETLEKKRNPKGVGLSSPQIGKNWRSFTTLLPDSANNEGGGRPLSPEEPTHLAIYLNPEILETSKTRTFGPDENDPILEGCLSIPGLYGPVPRWNWVRLQWLTPAFQKQEKIFYGFFARVIQHEFDHLEGILFTDYIKQLDLPIYKPQGSKMVEIDRSILADI
jgi:peptide deformylase